MAESLKYRKKPIVIEAVQWTGNMMSVIDLVGHDLPTYGEGHDGSLRITTLEGDHECRPGDWIIKGVKGELYPCKPDIFTLTYEVFESAVFRAGRGMTSAEDNNMDGSGSCHTPQASDLVYYGPHECLKGCGGLIVTTGNDHAGLFVLDLPAPPIYPNTEWREHICGRMSPAQETVLDMPAHG